MCIALTLLQKLYLCKLTVQIVKDFPPILVLIIQKVEAIITSLGI